ncbi:glycosyltransferase [Actinoplanes sp. NPDC051346]|uniref:bifunctional glycosyltransferase/CDP-glycerol:glycerophosphate glycerophosphotransferase n=1 Tax=Actinoplanes sp. NPDC051346 TaxID=3155048 RepID=UPI00343A6456
MFKVSIILACYNVEAFIDDAFQSIIKQTALAHIEVIPVNDGSTDGTWEIIQRYQERFPENFFPINFEHGSGGPGRPRNAGLDVARGEYVIFMDPDDRIYEDGYSLLLKKIEQHGSDVVIATRYGVKEKQGPESKVWIDWLAEQPYVNQNSYTVKLDLLSQRPVILKTIYRRSLIEEHKLRFLEGVSSSEDEIFDMKFLLLAERITKINDVVYLYTVERTGSITSKIRLKVYEDLEPIFAGLDDSLSVYFSDAIVAYRVAGLLRTFYLPKLLLLDPDQTDEALELTRKACEAFGFDRLMLTASPVDRRIIELLRDRNYSQLMLFFMDHRSRGLARRNRSQANKLKVLESRFVKAGIKAGETLKLGRRIVRERAWGKVRATRTPNGLGDAPNGYWVFMDRQDKASDNSEALYRYVRENRIHDKLAFVIAADSPDYYRLKREGFNVVAYNTLAHWRLLFNCEHFFASHVDNVIITPWATFGGQTGKPRYKLNFLQHGIIRSDLSGWLGTKNYHTFCTSARQEYESILNNVQYRLGPEQLKLTGLARHDLLKARSGDYILVAPTWRSFLTKATEQEFRESDFFKNWQDLIHDERMHSALASAGLHLKLMLHPSISQFAGCFTESDYVRILNYRDVVSFADLLSGAQLMVTDYSTISFDVLYLRRPVVYYSFPESQTHSTNNEADLQLYAQLGDLAYRHDAVVDAVLAAADRGFSVSAEKVGEIDRFFAFNDDQQNRKRIIEAVLGEAGQ